MSLLAIAAIWGYCSLHTVLCMVYLLYGSTYFERFEASIPALWINWQCTHSNLHTSFTWQLFQISHFYQMWFVEGSMDDACHLQAHLIKEDLESCQIFVESKIILGEPWWWLIVTGLFVRIAHHWIFHDTRILLLQHVFWYLCIIQIFCLYSYVWYFIFLHIWYIVYTKKSVTLLIY